MVKTRESILAAYQKEIAVQTEIISNLRSGLNSVSLSRLGAFIGEILIVALIISQGFHWGLGILLLLPIFYFLYLVKRQSILQDQLNYAEKLLFVYKNEEQVILSGRQNYNDGSRFASEAHPYTSDLDIYGVGSLYALINRSNTIQGMQLLADRLAQSLNLAEIAERQGAIKEFIENIHQTFHFRAGLQLQEPQQLETLKDKVSHEMPGQLTFIQGKFIRTYTKVAPFIAFALLGFAIGFGGILWQLFGLCFLFNLSLIFIYRKGVFGIYKGFGKSSDMFNSLARTVEWTKSITWNSPDINKLFGKEVVGSLDG